MANRYCRVVFDLWCLTPKLQPVYRIWVNNELFAERQWRWDDAYLEEILQIQAPPGRYNVRVESLNLGARFAAQNFRVEQGAARWIVDGDLEITQ